METGIGDDEDSNLGGFIEDTVIESPLENASDESLHCLPDTLPPRHQSVGDGLHLLV